MIKIDLSEEEKFAREIARSHLSMENHNITLIRWYPKHGRILLLEVEEPVFGANLFSDDIVLPISFGSTEDIPFSSSLIVLSQSEYNKLERNEILLPPEWSSCKKPVQIYPVIPEQENILTEKLKDPSFEETYKKVSFKEDIITP